MLLVHLLLSTELIAFVLVHRRHVDGRNSTKDRRMWTQGLSLRQLARQLKARDAKQYDHW